MRKDNVFQDILFYIENINIDMEKKCILTTIKPRKHLKMDIERGFHQCIVDFLDDFREKNQAISDYTYIIYHKEWTILDEYQQDWAKYGR